ncbi:MAG: LamG-like jellyroll fold domain-containing protein, partial [Verrucomicrobiota bacterium]|nr:LamG-like jellyroll fold domain-containing protein [Verrucomicrobiota bacterium]
YARTYVNGTFAGGNQRYERPIANELIINTTSDLSIGVNPDSKSTGFFRGMIDDVRLYGKAFGSEDVHHLFKGDPGYADYQAPRAESKRGGSGTVVKVQTPTLPAITPPSLTYGTAIKDFSLGGNDTDTYELSGLPNGLSNFKEFTPKDLPGLFAWYASDRNDSFSLHPTTPVDRNDTVAVDDLLIMLRFDENNGTQAHDSSGQGNHGRLIDQAAWVSGKFGNALSFDGDNDGLAFSKVEHMDRADAFTLSFWFNRNSDIAGTDNDSNHLINNLMLAQSSSFDNDNLEIGSEGGEIEVYFDTGGGAEDITHVTTGAGVTDGVWHHLVMTHGNGMKVYLDGSVVLDVPVHQGPMDTSQDSPLSLGMARIYSDQWGDFNGSIDEFRLYSRELNASEVGVLYGGGSGDFSGSTFQSYGPELISEWKDLSGGERNAHSSQSSAPGTSFELSTGKKIVSLRYGKSLEIPDAVSMPMTVFMVGRETGFSFPDRELFTFEGWRMAHNGRWSLRRWNNNNPALDGTVDSTVNSLVGWTVARYGYELRANGQRLLTNASGNWNPDALFDRINGDSALEIGEIVLFPRILDNSEMERLEGYLGHRWTLNEFFPSSHPYRATKPTGETGLVLNGKPERAGEFAVTAKVTNFLGTTQQSFNLTVQAIPPRIRTAGPRDVGSTSARLTANLVETGGEDSNVSFVWGTNPSSLSNETSPLSVSAIGETTSFLSGLSANTTYYYQAKAVNSAGISNGNALDALPSYQWDLNDTGSIAEDFRGLADGQITGANSAWDANKSSNVLTFDGTDDFISFGDLDEMDQIDRFTFSIWFKRTSDTSSTPTNHGVHNVLLGQSSGGSNDNLEIGTNGSNVQLYVDSGSAETDATVTFDAGLVNDRWYHLAVVYGSELSLFLDGVKISTWTQYNGRLESSQASPLSIGVARPNSNRWGDFSGSLAEARIYLSELSDEEIGILAGGSSVQSFTTGDSLVPPIVRVSPATLITDSNATLNYELVSYDGAQPEVIMYWGRFDQMHNEGLWENNQSLGTRGVGSGSLGIGGYSAGETVFYQVRAKGQPYEDWSDLSGQFKTVSLPAVVSLAATTQTASSATLNGEVTGNGGVSVTISLDPPAVSDGLLGHWRFDEGQGSETYDSTGLSPTAEIFSGVTWTEGMGGSFETALKFDGSSFAYVDLGDFRLEGSLSFSAWVWKDNFANYQRVFDFGNGAGSHNLILCNRWNSNQAEWSIRRGGTPSSLYAQDFWSLNEWQHVVAAVDESGVMKLYRNGEMRGSNAGHLPQGVTRSQQFLGRSNWANDAYFKGMMDDLRIYGRALSLDEVSRIFQGDLNEDRILGGEDPSLTIYWGDEDPGDTIEVNASSALAWDANVSLGVIPLGVFSHTLQGLQANKNFTYRILATNSAGSVWSSQSQSFSTGDFSFQPQSIAGGDLLLWLDASDLNGDGNGSNEPFAGTVDQWRDKSGSLRHAGNGNGPNLQSGGLNGLNTLKFDGISQYLRVADSNVFDFGDEVTIFIVGQGHSSQNWRPMLSKRGENDKGWQFRKTNTDYAAFTVRGTSDADSRTGGTPFNGDFHVWAMRKSPVHKSQWADGNLEFKVVDTGIVPSAPTDDLVIGARDQDGIGSFASVEVAEIIIFGKSLPDEQVAQVQGYLGHKWGLVAKMPQAHAYKNSKPIFENRPEIQLPDPYPLVLDQNVSISLSANRPASSYGATNLPVGLSLNSMTGVISGAPSVLGDQVSVVEATNSAGSLSKALTFQVRDFSGWPFDLNVTFGGYSGTSTLSEFPVYLELNASIPGFSYEQFASPYGYDLRFLSSDGSNELFYEVVRWNPSGTSAFWVLLPELNASTTIRAVWGNPNATDLPSYCLNGSVWNKYRGVWHMDDGSTDLVRDSRGSYHATPNNFDELYDEGVIGKALNFDGVNDYLDMSLGAHPPSGTEQLTISFWSKGGFDTLSNTT